jgi:hypothetical protein
MIPEEPSAAKSELRTADAVEALSIFRSPELDRAEGVNTL